MKTKVFKTIDEQISILQARGLIIDDIDFAKDTLIRENYFFINGYRHLFLKNGSDKNYKEGTNFKEIIALFNFDRQIRNILFKNLLVVENNMKSIFSYQLSKQYGYKEKDYLKATNFSRCPEKQRQINDLIRKMKRQIRINVSRHSATMHYSKNYGYIPLWILVKVLSFGIMCELYTILKDKDKENVAETFGIDPNLLEEMLPILSNYRNLCAHEDIVFDHKTERAIPDTEYHNKLKIFKMDDEYIYGKNDMFSVIIIFKYLLSKDNFRLMMKEIEYEIDKLDGRIDTIPIQKVLDYMGFPKNYLEIVEM